VEVSMIEKPQDLGAQDPELKNSPVAWETDEDTEALREAVPGSAACYFNGNAYTHGTLIRSGSTVLRCDGGVWVPEGAGD
jgi:hypothetical protein